MAGLSEIRAGLAENLRSIQGIQVSPWLLSNPTPPAIEIQPGEIDWDRAMQRGLDELTLTIRAFVAISTDIGAQHRLDELLAPSGPSSVKAAAESDRTLGGLVDDLRVTRCTGYRLFTRDGGVSVLGAEWTVQIFASPKGDA